MCCATTIVALEAMLFAPVSTIWLWAVLLGLGQGALVSLALTIIVLRSPNPSVASQLSALAQFVGYLLAAAGPFFVGWIRSLTGTFAWCSLLFAIVGTGLTVNGWLAGRPAMFRTTRWQGRPRSLEPAASFAHSPRLCDRSLKLDDHGPKSLAST